MKLVVRESARVLLLLCCLSVLCTQLWAQGARLATGSRLEDQLASNVSVAWTDMPIAEAITSLGASQQVAVVLDRRIDPGQQIAITLSPTPLADAFERIAKQAGIGYCQLGPVAYFGPEQSARRLRTLAALRVEDVRALPQPARGKLLELRSSEWEDLAEPRELLRKLAAEAGVELKGTERIPHDLWRGAELPPMSWLDRMTLIAAQFDLTFKVAGGGRTIELVPCPQQVALTRTYQGGQQPARLVEAWRTAAPDARITIDGPRIRVVARLEDHETIERRLRGAPTSRTTTTVGREVYQLTIENAALDRVVDQLATRLNLEFRWDRPAIEKQRITMNQLISVSVENASLDDVLKAVFKGTGLTYRKTEGVVEIFPEPK